MGINGFRVKLIAFALGATLAGLAGTVQAHVTYTVTPEQYQFAAPVPPNSAFLLAAVVLGGMGTISGPLVGAALLYLIPAKLPVPRRPTSSSPSASRSSCSCASAPKASSPTGAASSNSTKTGRQHPQSSARQGPDP